MVEVVPVIIAGGSGTRLWPLSRELYPKQFLSLDGDRSILQQTLVRLAGPGFGAPTVVSNEEHRFLILEQAEEVGQRLRQVILEPEGRNTAPALTVAALLLREGNPVLLMTPADHYIADKARFHACLARACERAADGCIVTLGVKPSRPETGYGYIRVDAGGDLRNADALPVRGFTEKPDAETAEDYVSSGDYFWNSGMFILHAEIWLRAMERFRPDILEACMRAVDSGREDGAFFRAGRDAFLQCPADSIDYAVMEKAAGDPEFECVVVPFDDGWSDIGSWKSVWELADKDKSGNCVIGNAALQDTSDSMVISQDRLVSVLGIHGVVVAETADAVLVADLGKSQALGGMVKALKRRGGGETSVHRRVYRPWGSYENIVESSGYQVKRLTVKPGHQLSLQMHHRRAEHWVVVRGKASIVRGDEQFSLSANESIYIPRGTKHRLGNDSGTPLEVIEVQTGDYLGEDDIVRFEDDFGRVE